MNENTATEEQMREALRAWKRQQRENNYVAAEMRIAMERNRNAPNNDEDR